MTRKILGAVASLALLNTIFVPALPSFGQVRPTSVDLGSNVFQLERCASESELDCIQSLEVVDQDGASVFASPQNGSSSWSVDSYFFNGLINPQVTLEKPEHLIFVSENGQEHFGGALRLNLLLSTRDGRILAPKQVFSTESFPSELQGLRFRISVRTSWLKPQNVQLVASDADFSQQSISGGNLWTFSGSPVHVTSYNNSFDLPEKRNFSAQGDFDSLEFHFFIHHAGIDSLHSYFDPRCSDFGYTVQSFNSNGAGSPEWNNENKSLDFHIFAPHTNTKGQLNTGFFKLWTTDAFINCRWPENTLKNGSYLTAEIRNPDGTTQVANINVVHENGKVFLEVEDFHYSAPTIQIRSNATPPTNRVKNKIALKNFKYSSKPRLVGVAKVGKTLKVNAGKWDKSVKLTYSWFRNGIKIVGANKSTYKLKASDRKKRITVSVTGRKLGYNHITKKSASVLAR